MSQVNNGVLIASTSALSVAANATSADQVSALYQYPKVNGIYTLFAKASATGLNATLSVNGYPLIQDLVIPFTGTAGTLSSNDNCVTSVSSPPGRVQLTFRNTTAGAITVDSQVFFLPTRR